MGLKRVETNYTSRIFVSGYLKRYTLKGCKIQILHGIASVQLYKLHDNRLILQVEKKYVKLSSFAISTMQHHASSTGY